MSARAMGPGRRGFTMVELIVAIVVSTIVLAAAYMLLSNNQRFYRSQSQVVDVQQNVRAVGQIIPSELREISASGGDIIAMSDSVLEIRAMRGLGTICDTTALASGSFKYRNAQFWSFTYVNPTRHYVLIFNDGVPTQASDDSWVEGVISSTVGSTCPGSLTADATTMTMSSVTGGFATLASVTTNSPFRLAERVRYNLMEENGKYYLGAASFVSGAWTTPSAVAGPLRAVDGIHFDYFDDTGAVTADPTAVASIRITVRGESQQTVRMQGRPEGTYADSLAVTVALRGN